MADCTSTQIFTGQRVEAGWVDCKRARYVYELDEALRPLKHYCLGDPDKVTRAIEIKCAVTFAPRARDDYVALSAYDRSAVRDAMNTHLLHQPMQASKRRIKRLREMSGP